MKIYQIPKGTILYRFLSMSPNKYNSFYDNTGKDGRFNKNQFVYYCATSMEAMLEEANAENQQIQGILILSDVIKPIQIAVPSTDEEYLLVRSSYTNKETKLIQKVKEYLPFVFGTISSYEDTSAWFDNKMKSYPFLDGVGYPSTRSLTICKNHIIYYLNDNDLPHPSVRNIALSKKGYDKIKERPPIVYWH